MRTTRYRLPLLCILAGTLVLSPGLARADRPDVDRERTQLLVSAYENAEGWPVKALALLALGQRWHPDGAALLVNALGDRDRRLHAYALEALRETAAPHLRCVLTADLVDKLIDRYARARNALVKTRLVVLLTTAFPEVEATHPHEWQSWWRTASETYTPAPWVERGRPDLDPTAESTTVPATSIVRRAMDLSQGGIQLVLVIDTTGSMQPTIDATRAGLADVVDILSGIARKFEVGVVQYKDVAELGGRDEAAGARVLTRLTSNVDGVQRRLETLAASGGGDFPERVFGGLWLALQRKMGWHPEANKMVIVIGDAPPHRIDETAELAGRARREPEAFLWSSRPRTGRPSGPPPKPFLTSTVAVGMARPMPQTARAFERISRAGGGVAVLLATQGGTRKLSRAIVRRMIELSFGTQYATQARRLVDVYFQYRGAGLFRE